jgi:hypothetical protein
VSAVGLASYQVVLRFGAHTACRCGRSGDVADHDIAKALAFSR